MCPIGNHETQNRLVMSRCNRAFLGTMGFAILFGTGLIFNYYLGNLTFSFLYGSLVGILLGVIMCLYLSNAYDLITMHPKNPNALLAGSRGYIGALLGVLAANILISFFGKNIQNFVIGCILVWLFITMGYITFHLCKNSFR